MKRNKMKFLVAGLTLLLMAGFAFSQEMGGGPGPGHHGEFEEEHILGFFTKALDLTDAQQSQIKQIIANEKPTLQPLMAQERQAHEQMMQLATGGAFDEAKAQALATQESQTHVQLEVEHAKIMSQAYALLTPDQKTKFAQMRAKHQAHMSQHMQKEQSEQTPQQ